MLKLRDIAFVVLGGLGLAAVGAAIMLPSQRYALAQFTGNDGYREIERYRTLGDCETARLNLKSAFKLPDRNDNVVQCVQLHGKQADAFLGEVEKEAASIAFEKSTEVSSPDPQ